MRRKNRIWGSNLTSKPAYARIAESEEKYRRLFEFSEDPMWLISGNKFEICNDAAVRILGYDTQEELASIHPSALSPPIQECGTDSFTKAEEMMAKATLNGYHRFEWLHRKKNGENFPVEVTLTAIPYGGDTAIYCVWRDISERRLAEKDLHEAKASAEAANRTKSKFLALMSHELRTPLNAVIGFSEFLSLQSTGPLLKKQQEIVSNIHRGGSILLNLVDDLLDFAKLENDQIEIDLQRVDVVDALNTAFSIIQNGAENKQVTIHREYTPNIPIWVCTDKLRLIQSVVNMLSNAVKYNETGGNVWLKATLNEEGTSCSISVRDDGFGIKPDQLHCIFEAFNRGNQRYSSIEGTGLGLNVTKRLVAAMGGSINCESTWGEGSSFHIELSTKYPDGTSEISATNP